MRKEEGDTAGMEAKPEVSLKPVAIGPLEADLSTNLDTVRERLRTVQEDVDRAENNARQWARVIGRAKLKYKRLKREGSLSKNADAAASQLIQDAEQRLAVIERYEITTSKEELVRLRNTEAALSSLKSRLDLQRFRERFTEHTVSITDAHVPLSQTNTTLVTGMDADTLSSIEREVKIWSNSIQAWKELKTHE